MMRSMYSGVSGLKSHQTKMDVIGNNIANVNTVGFKSSSVVFKDALYQTTANAKAANAQTNTGGTAGKQIGLGSGVSEISYDPSGTGSMQSTGYQFDLMISGNSFFVVNQAGINYFTKVGSFDKDNAGNLVTATGAIVQGWLADPDTGEIIRDQVKGLKVGGVDFETADAEMTSKMYVGGNIDSRDPNLTTEDGVKMSSTLYDNLGYSYTANYKITKVQTGTNALGEPEYSDSQYNVELLSIKNSKNEDILKDGYSATPVNSIINFDLDSGKFITVGTDLTQKIDNMYLEITPTDAEHGDVFRVLDTKATAQAGANVYDPANIEIDFSHLQMYATNNVSSVQLYRGDIAGNYAGLPVGNLSSIAIDEEGIISGVYSNGVSKVFGQIAVASFTNPTSLRSVGNSMYATTNNSGDFDGIGRVVSENGGSITQGVLEMSNVDLSSEFTEMIVTQRGFQANSRIITVSDTLLEELINLKR